jgi:signal transduction histidine kinase
MKKSKILVVEDMAIVSTFIKSVLERAGYEVVGTFSSGEDAVAFCEEETPDLVLMDIMLDGPMNGIDATKKILAICDLPIIYLTALSDTATMEMAKRTGPFAYIIKPFEEHDLLNRVDLALYKFSLDKELVRDRLKHLIEGQEMERARISRELHDGLGQILNSIRFTLESSVAYDDQKAIKANLIELTEKAIKDMRSIISNLIPLRLQDFDLKSCIISLAEECTRPGISYDLQIDPQPLRINQAQKTAIYRIVQESFQNILKHAQANMVALQLYSRGNMISLSIEDDGKGFDPTMNSPGNGIRNIKDRVEVLLGTFLLESEPGKGTYLSIEIPID